MSFTVTMVDVQGNLEREIADKRLTRDDVLLTYAFGIRDCPDEVDWAKVNGLIVDRWSLNALKYIKEGAWRKVAARSVLAALGAVAASPEGRRERVARAAQAISQRTPEEWDEWRFTTGGKAAQRAAERVLGAVAASTGEADEGRVTDAMIDAAMDVARRGFLAQAFNVLAGMKPEVRAKYDEALSEQMRDVLRAALDNASS